MSPTTESAATQATGFEDDPIPSQTHMMVSMTLNNIGTNAWKNPP